MQQAEACKPRRLQLVNTAALKLRSAASTDSESITLLAQGESYPIVETGDAWTKIQLDTVTGYVKNEYITISYNMPTAKAVSAPAQDTTTTEAPTTEAPTTEAPTTEAPVTEAPTSDLGQQIANFACQFVGNPYVWGGTSLTNGADCSGFVQSVYKNFGYSLPRTCTPQSNAGTAVSLAALAPGDSGTLTITVLVVPRCIGGLAIGALDRTRSHAKQQPYRKSGQISKCKITVHHLRLAEL
ncbi:MAG: C40 family peptidase [Coprococcus sp.]